MTLCIIHYSLFQLISSSPYTIKPIHVCIYTYIEYIHTNISLKLSHSRVLTWKFSNPLSCSHTDKTPLYSLIAPQAEFVLQLYLTAYNSQSNSLSAPPNRSNFRPQLFLVMNTSEQHLYSFGLYRCISNVVAIIPKSYPKRKRMYTQQTLSK